MTKIYVVAGSLGLFTGSCAPIFLFIGLPCGALFDPLGIPACFTYRPLLD